MLRSMYFPLHRYLFPDRKKWAWDFQTCSVKKGQRVIHWRKFGPRSFATNPRRGNWELKTYSKSYLFQKFLSLVAMEFSSLPRTVWFSINSTAIIWTHLKENFLSLPVLIFHTKPFVFLRDDVFYTAAHTILFGKQKDNSFGDLKLYDTHVPCSWKRKQKHGSIMFALNYDKSDQTIISTTPKS